MKDLEPTRENKEIFIQKLKFLYSGVPMYIPIDEDIKFTKINNLVGRLKKGSTVMDESLNDIVNRIDILAKRKRDRTIEKESYKDRVIRHVIQKKK